MHSLFRFGWTAVRHLLVFTVLLGLVLPTLVWGIGRLVAPGISGGGFLTRDGVVVGSRLIGQQFTQPEYFWGRPSAADYDPMASGGTNQGPNSEALRSAVQQRRLAIAKANRVAPEQVPADALTASGSGLDPLISPAYAELQVARIARVRGLTSEQVRAVIRTASQGRSLGVLGAPGVNVLIANLELDRLS